MGVDVGRITGSLTNVRHWFPLAITGGLSAATGAVLPGMVGLDMNPWAKLGVQVVSAIAGGVVVEKVTKSGELGKAWMIGGISIVGYNLLKTYLLIPYFPQFAVTLSDYPAYGFTDVSQEADMPNVSAFPQAIHDYPGVGAFVSAYPQELSSYPYDGAYGM